MTTSSPCTIRAAGEGSSYWVLSDLLTLKLGPAETGGRYTIVETVVPPGGGPPPHAHAREDEMFYVLDGEFAFVVDQHVVRGSRGFATYLPKGGVHTFKNVGDRPGRLLVVATPSGFEQFVVDAGCDCADIAAAAPAVDDVALGRLMAACAKHGVEMRMDHKADAPAPPRAADRELWVLGVHVRMKLASADTGGNFSMAEVTVLPGGGVPPHLHRREDEFFHVLDGALEFAIADAPGGPPRAVTAMPGSFLHVPKGTLHGFRNLGDRPARVLDYHTPGGFERFFEEAGTECHDVAVGPPAGEPDMAQTIAVIHKHGMEMPAA